MESPSTGINVYLSTTRHALDCSTRLEDFQEADCPVCTADVHLGMIGFGGDLEKTENQYSQIMLKMAQTVYVNSKEKSLYVGEDPVNMDSGGLIIYQETRPENNFANDFFKQWDLKHMLLLEFAVYDMTSTPRFVLKGFWDGDKWHGLKIDVGQNIKLINTKGL